MIRPLFIVKFQAHHLESSMNHVALFIQLCLSHMKSHEKAQNHRKNLFLMQLVRAVIQTVNMLTNHPNPWTNNFNLEYCFKNEKADLKEAENVLSFHNDEVEIARSLVYEREKTTREPNNMRKNEKSFRSWKRVEKKTTGTYDSFSIIILRTRVRTKMASYEMDSLRISW